MPSMEKSALLLAVTFLFIYICAVIEKPNFLDIFYLIYLLITFIVLRTKKGCQ